MHQWAMFLHILSAFAFLAAHGVSMLVLYRIRGERDRQRILDLVTLTGATTVPMYVALLAIVVTGVWAGLIEDVFGQLWIWLAIILLVVTVVLMGVTARPYFERLKLACEVRPSGVPRVSDEELAQILRSSRAHVITAIGAVGLLGILYLMVFKPFLT